MLIYKEKAEVKNNNVKKVHKADLIRRTVFVQKFEKQLDFVNMRSYEEQIKPPVSQSWGAKL